MCFCIIIVSHRSAWVLWSIFFCLHSSLKLRTSSSFHPRTHLLTTKVPFEMSEDWHTKWTRLEGGSWRRTYPDTLEIALGGPHRVKFSISWAHGVIQQHRSSLAMANPMKTFHEKPPLTWGSPNECIQYVRIAHKIDWRLCSPFLLAFAHRENIKNHPTLQLSILNSAMTFCRI